MAEDTVISTKKSNTSISIASMQEIVVAVGRVTQHLQLAVRWVTVQEELQRELPQMEEPTDPSIAELKASILRSHEMSRRMATEAIDNLRKLEIQLSKERQDASRAHMKPKIGNKKAGKSPAPRFFPKKKVTPSNEVTPKPENGLSVANIGTPNA